MPCVIERELRDQGHSITRSMVAVTNRFGEPCRVARYELMGE